MESVDAGIFFDQMMSDLSDGNLSRKEDMVQFFKRYDTNPNQKKNQGYANLVELCFSRCM
jgi:hypothetical protein